MSLSPHVAKSAFRNQFVRCPRWRNREIARRGTSILPPEYLAIHRDCRGVYINNIFVNRRAVLGCIVYRQYAAVGGRVPGARTLDTIIVNSTFKVAHLRGYIECRWSGCRTPGSERR